jgi:hypothetical protein
MQIDGHKVQTLIEQYSFPEPTTGQRSHQIIYSMSGVINPLIGVYIQGLCRILTIGWMSIDHIYIYMYTHHVMILAHMCIIDTEKNSCTSTIAIYI